MRMVNLATVAALVMLAAGPALAGEPRGGGHPGGGCGGNCGGGGHRPPPPPPGGGTINVNVNANASASAFAGASAGGFFNARAYDVGGIRGRGYGGGTVYVGGGYGGDAGGCGGYCGGAPVYNEEIYQGRTCASAPFGYVVSGFGRNGRRPPTCLGGGGGDCRDDQDRGGRYGYSERHSCGGGRREAYGYEEGSHGSYESHESYEAYESYGGGCGGGCGGPDVGIGAYERGYIDGRNSCGGCDDDHGDDDAPYPPPYLPEPPRYHPPTQPDRPYRPRLPRQDYRQEPGERG